MKRSVFGNLEKQVRFYDLFHYTTVTRFEEMLMEGGLFFRQISEFKDKWEGLAIPEMSRSAEAKLRARQKEVTKRYGAHCWCSQTHESALHWAAYGKGIEGVALCVSRKELLEALRKTDPEVSASLMSYNGNREHEAEAGEAPSDVFRKRKEFKAEQEFRFVTKLNDEERENGGAWRRVPIASIIVEIRLRAGTPPWLTRTMKNRLLLDTQDDYPGIIETKLHGEPTALDFNWRERVLSNET